MESDIDFSSLVSSLLSYDFSEERMYTVPGETDAGAEYEEYYVDEDAFYDLIIQLFYEKVE
jgi:hypothetical protein